MPESSPAVDRFAEAKASFFEGLACFEAGRFDDAERCYLRSLELLPARVSTLVNLAAAQLKLWRLHEALATADAVLAIEPDNLDAWFHRGGALSRLGRHAEALECFDRVLALTPDGAEPWLRHGETLQCLGRHAEALVSYDKALALDPQLADAWSHRGGIMREQMRLGDAADAFRRAIDCGADADLNQYFLASVGGVAAPAASPRHYVEPLFDDYAEQFDDHLLRVLRYQAHTVLVGKLARLHPGRFGAALDLGCGTGLCGPLLRPRVGHLTGVDLSAAMLDKARALGVYDELLHADIVATLNSTDRRYDLIVAADVFIYVGDLAPVFAAARRALGPAGLFCFSAEPAAPGTPGFELLPTLRYAHSEHYLRQQAAKHGFEVALLQRGPMREDQRTAVEGFYVYMTRR